MFFAYNLRGIFNPGDKNLLKKLLRELWPMLFEKIVTLKVILRLVFETK